MALDTNGRDRDRVVRRYLSALDAQRPGRTPTKTAETLHLRMHQIDTDLMSADQVQRLHLTQERIDLHSEHLRLLSSTADLAELEKAFVRVARGYGDRHGISYSAWRQVGVDADVLRKAGINPAAKAPRPEPAAAAAEPEAEPDAQPAKKVAAKKAPAAAKKAPAKNNGVTRAVKKTATTSS